MGLNSKHSRRNRPVNTQHNSYELCPHESYLTKLLVRDLFFSQLQTMDHLFGFAFALVKSVSASSQKPPKPILVAATSIAELPKLPPIEIIKPKKAVSKAKAEASEVKKNPNRKRGEGRVRTTLERITTFKWPTIRPAFLKKLDTNRPMELDMYCAEMNIACEYQGIQHYKLEGSEFFYKTQEDFDKAQQNDILKAKLCKENGVKLIVIDSRVFEKLDQDNPKALEDYLLQKLGEVLV